MNPSDPLRLVFFLWVFFKLLYSFSLFSHVPTELLHLLPFALLWTCGDMFQVAFIPSKCGVQDHVLGAWHRGIIFWLVAERHSPQMVGGREVAEGTWLSCHPPLGLLVPNAGGVTGYSGMGLRWCSGAVAGCIDATMLRQSEKWSEAGMSLKDVTTKPERGSRMQAHFLQGGEKNRASGPWGQ